jgi:hypothetical protein
MSFPTGDNFLVRKKDTTVKDRANERHVSLDTYSQPQPSLFLRGGIEDAHTRILATGGVGIIISVFSWIPIFSSDRLGRKTWLQIGTMGMMCAMVGTPVLQWRAENNVDSAGSKDGEVAEKREFAQE